MKQSIILFFIIIIILIPEPGSCLESTGNINFAFGILQTDNDFSKNFGLNEKVEAGLFCEMKKENWPFMIAFSYILSYGKSSIPKKNSDLKKNKNVNIYSSETYIGIKKIFDIFYSVKPFVGAGICTISMYADISYDHDYAYGIGTWVQGGVYYFFAKKMHIGLDWRWSKANVKLFNKNLNAGGNHFNLMIGHQF